MKKKRVAVIRCAGSAALRHPAPEGQNKDCASLKISGPEESSGCLYGCLGGGSCREVCPRQAIILKESGTAEVKREKCIGCGKCVKICPQQLIELIPEENAIQPFCCSRASAKETRAVCSLGCIGCGICEKVCPAGAVHVAGGHAVIMQERCISCGMCAAKCPRGVIHDANGIISIR